MESFGQQYSESLISSLSYTLGRTSSAIVDRREAQVKPRGATSYTPRGAKTIEFTLTDSGSYALLNTIRFQAKLRAQDPSRFRVGWFFWSRGLGPVCQRRVFASVLC